MPMTAENFAAQVLRTDPKIELSEFDLTRKIVNVRDIFYNRSLEGLRQLAADAGGLGMPWWVRQLLSEAIVAQVARNLAERTAERTAERIRAQRDAVAQHLTRS